MVSESGWWTSRRQGLTVLAGVAISIAVLGWAAYWVDLRGALHRLRGFEGAWILPMLLFYLSSFLVRGVRWCLLLQPVGTVPWSTSTGVIFSGYMANNLLPFRLGEIVRALVLTRVTSVRMEGTLSTIVLERVLDGLVLVGMIAFVLPWTDVVPGKEGVVAYTGAVSAVVFAGALLLVIAVRLFPRVVLRVSSQTLEWAPVVRKERGVSMVRSVLRGLETLTMDRRLLAVLFLSVAVWALEGGMFWVGLQAFALDADVAIALLTLAFVNLSILIPSAPGYVGVFQGATILAFAAFGLPEETALSYAVVVHALQYVSATAIGIGVLAKYGISLAALRQESISHEHSK